MTNLYLILHKVRSEPAFDIACRCDDMGTESDPGPWWIIPTSGHRAHPGKWWLLEDLEVNKDGYVDRPWTHDDNPAIIALPDHYTTSRAPRIDLVTALGLNTPAPAPNFKRRV